MIELLFPAVLFVVVAAVINGQLLLKKKYPYDEKWYLFIPILLFSSVVLLLIYDIPVSAPTATVAISLIFLISVYLGLSYVWYKTLVALGVYGIETIPVENQNIVRVKPLADATKLVEILFQDVVALATVLTLTQITADNTLAILILTVIVFIVHIPGIKLFGRIFGTFWLFASTALAPIAYYLLSFEQGLYYLFILHSSTYLLLYSSIYILSKTRSRY